MREAKEAEHDNGTDRAISTLRRGDLGECASSADPRAACLPFLVGGLVPPPAAAVEKALPDAGAGLAQPGLTDVRTGASRVGRGVLGGLHVGARRDALRSLRLVVHVVHPWSDVIGDAARDTARGSAGLTREWRETCPPGARRRANDAPRFARRRSLSILFDVSTRYNSAL